MIFRSKNIQSTTGNISGGSSVFDDANYCRISQGSEQTINNTTNTTVNLDTVTYDPSSMCNTTAHTVTILEDGIYLVTFFGSLTSTDACGVSWGILKNSDANNLMQTTATFPADDSSIFLSGLASLVTNDVLTPKIYIWNSTGTFKIYAASRNTYLEIVKVRNS